MAAADCGRVRLWINTALAWRPNATLACQKCHGASREAVELRQPRCGQDCLAKIVGLEENLATRADEELIELRQLGLEPHELFRCKVRMCQQTWQARKKSEEVLSAKDS